MSTQGPVLVSWCARNNDPYERDRKGAYSVPAVAGPTLTLLFDPQSEYANRVNDVVLLSNDAKGEQTGGQVLRQTIEAIKLKRPTARCEQRIWQSQDPTDHRAIYEFLKTTLPAIREKFRDRELVIHISPGTPSMQTIWVLMAECGMIEPPFTIVKSYRSNERGGRAAVVPVQVGIDTFYKAFRNSKPTRVASTDEQIFWDPTAFKSRKLIDLYREAQRFARLRVPVLILGERGTGKTTLANWIRANSPFRKAKLDGNWASVPCGQYSPETMRSELFGYMKGAFTGADRNHEGLLQMADGDTLFLDEIGDISRDVQRLLIRALEEGRYFRLGSTTAEKSCFRLISATNLSGEKLHEVLDSDFYDRVGGLQLRVPSLREIPEDLTWLWQTCCATAVQRCGMDARQVPDLTQYHSPIVRVLQRRPLDGNLRDLFRIANRLIAFVSESAAVLAEEAVAYATSGLDTNDVQASSGILRRVADAFQNGRGLETVLLPGEKLSTTEVESELRGFIATEIRRIARSRAVEPEQICDVSARTLRGWANLPLGDRTRQKSSAVRHKAATALPDLP